MPNFDGGHYFLTTLAPIRTGYPEDQIGEDYVQRVRRALQKIPTAKQSPATMGFKAESPFVKSKRTHLCRFVVIDDAVYNGRPGDDPILTNLPGRVTPPTPKHVDTLPCAYLMFVADFDAVRKPGDPLPDALTPEQQDAIRDDYLCELWENSSAELIRIYQNCQMFDEDRIKTPQDFCNYMKKCQIETWMSFNDYYIDPPALPALPTKALLAAIGLPALAFLAFGIAWLTGCESILGMSSGILAVLSVILLGIALFGSYRFVLEKGQIAWPAAKFGDLPSVLKAVYLQQHFSDFAVASQGQSDAALFDSFGDFLRKREPDNVLAKTQPPGVIHAPE